MASVTVFKNGEKKLNCSQALNFLLTGLRIYTGKSKARGPHNALPSVRHYVGPWALYSPVQIRKPVSKKIVSMFTFLMKRLNTIFSY